MGDSSTEGIMVQHYCVPNAIRDAWSLADKGWRVRIVTYPIKKGEDHAQAQMFVPGSGWAWVTTHNSEFGPRRWEPHFKHDPATETYHTLDQFIRDQIRWPVEHSGGSE